MGIDAVARLLSVSAQKLMKGAYGIDGRVKIFSHFSLQALA